jgi:pilus assembly protein CpaD
MNSTIAAMIANPADLVRGQPGATSVDPLASTKPIDAFRKAQLSGAGGQTIKSESTGGR